MDTKKKNIIRRIALGVCSAAVVVCITLLCVFLGIPKTSNGGGLGPVINVPNNSASTSADPSESTSKEGFAKKFVIKSGTTNAEKGAVWKEAVTTSGKVLITFEDDWTATGGTFGTDPATFETATFTGLCVPGGADLVIDLNGHTIDRGLTSAIVLGSVMAFDGNSKCVITGGGTITGGNTQPTGGAYGFGGGLYMRQTSQVTLNGVTVTGNKSHGGGGIAVTASSKLIINDANITGNEVLGAAAYATGYGGGGILGTSGTSNATVEMNGGSINGNQAVFGGGVSLYGAKFTMNGGSVSSNTVAYSSQDGGGGFYVGNTATLNLNGGQISNNSTTDGFGGGIRATNGATINMKGGKVSGNYTTNAPGGGICLNFSGTGGSTITIEGGEISGNSTGGGCGGGGLFLRDGNHTLNLKGGLISGNTASSNGGGINLSPTATVVVTGGMVTGNTAGSGGTGGGIYVTTGMLTYKGGLVCKGNNGSNMYIASGCKLQIPASASMTGTCIGLTAPITGSGASATSAVLTSGYNVTTGGRPNTWFFSDNSAYIAAFDGPPDGIYLYPPNSMTNKVVTISWQYKLTGDTSWNTVPSNGNMLDLTYDGRAVTDVQAEYTIDSTTYTQIMSDFFVVSDSRNGGGALDTTSADVGTISFAMDTRVSTIVTGTSSGIPREGATFTINIKPKPITVDLSGQSAIYGKTPEYKFTTTGLVGSDTVAGLGITVKKSYGDEAGTYDLYPTGWTNKNYDVTFTGGAGAYEIKKRDVIVIINDDEADYGKTKNISNDEISSAENNTANADGDYIGGWRYGKKTDGTDSDKFHSDDLTTTVKPFKLVSTQTDAAEKNGTTEHDKYAPVKYDGSATDNSTQTGKKVTGYQIVADSTSLNTNYNIKFVWWDKEGNGGAGAQDDTKAYGIFTVKEAELDVGKDGTSNDYYESIAFEDLPSGGKKASITGTITTKGATEIKGDVTPPATVTVTKTWLEQPDLTLPANSGWTAPTESTFMNSTYTWSAESAMPAKTSAGTYTFYFKLSAPNHAIKIQKWQLKITAADQNYTFKVESVVIDSTASPATETKTDITNVSPLENAYGKDTVVRVSATDTDGSALPTGAKYTVYYKCTDAGATFGVWDPATDQNPADADDKISVVDNKKHKDYGTTEEPKAAGNYQAKLVADSDSSYSLISDSGSDVITFKITKQKVGGSSTGAIKLPKDGSTPANKTYNAKEQTFTVSDYDSGIFKLGTLPTGMTDKNNTFTTAGATTFTLEATSAGDYKVPVKLKDENNYEWDSSVTLKTDTGVTPNEKYWELELKIAKVKVGVTYGHPSNKTTGISWTWKPGTYPTTSGGTDKYITYKITESTLIPVGGTGTTKEDVHLKLYWCKQPDSGAATPLTTNISVDGTTQLEVLDVSGITKGKYYAYVAMDMTKDTSDPSGKTLKYPANANYEIEVDNTSKLPKTYKQAFEVTDGSADLSGLKWTYSYTKDGTPYTDTYIKGSVKDDPDSPGTDIPAPELDTHIVYGLNADKSVIEYTFSVDTATNFPSYLEIDTNPPSGASSKLPAGVTFNTSGYAQQKYGVAGKHKTYVAVKIKSGEAVKFESTGTGYKYVDDTHAVIEYEWEIEKYKIDPNDVVELGYKIKDKKTSTLGEFNKFAIVKEGDETVYEVGVPDGGNGIVVAVNLPADLTKEPYDVSVILKSGTISGKGTNISPETKQTATGTYLSTTIPFSILTGATDNYEFAKDEDGNILSSITIKWRVVASTIPSGEIVWSEPDPEDPTKYVDGDGHPTTLTGEVDEIDKDGNKTGKKITVTLPTPKLKAGDDKVEYVYVWNDGSEEKVFKGLQGLYELISISERTYGGGILPGDVKVKAEAKEGYRLDPSVPATGLETPVVIGDTKIRVQVTAEGKLEGSYKAMDVTFKVEELDASGNASEYDTDLYTLWIYPNGEESNKVKFSTEELNKLTSGKHLVVLELVNTVGYKIALGSERFEITVNKIELEIPTMVNNPVFSGAEQNVEELLDEGYKAIKDLVTVSGQNAARNKGSYTLVITINDTDNYVWKASGKSAAKYVLAEEVPAPESTRVSDAEVDIGWQMLPYAIAVTPDMWSVSKEKDAKLNVEIPAGMEAVIGYNYYESKAGGTALSELSNGASVWASAVLTGADAENGNVVFADSGINETSERVAHTVVIPKSGFAAAASTALNFVKKNWLWFAIGGGIFLFLLLLIIILAATRKRRKEKAEERKLEKERKAEEKAKKEEERRLKEEQREEEKRRREQEREDAKAKAEAERELQKAKAEAELAKMRAEMGMAGAGAMAMQAMQPQQQMPQPAQQAMPMQQQAMQPQQQMPQYPQMPQPYYPQAMSDMNSAAMFAKIEAELAELRADRRQSQQAAYGPMPGYQAGADPAMMAKMEAEFVKMQAKQEASQEVSAAKMELEFMKMRSGYPSAMPMQQLAGAQQPGLLSMPNQAVNGGGFTTQQVGEIMAAMMRNMSAPQAPVKEPKEVIEAETKSTVVDTPTVYPPDAVITTTTTVDTTKKPQSEQPQRISREDDGGKYFDIDGFYDTFEENK